MTVSLRDVLEAESVIRPHIRTTPAMEVDLCGHATLASAYVIDRELQPGRTHVRFHSRSGPLDVSRDGAVYALDFPSQPPAPVTPEVAQFVAEAQRPFQIDRPSNRPMANCGHVERFLGGLYAEPVPALLSPFVERSKTSTGATDRRADRD